jgi:hypothetical protein
VTGIPHHPQRSTASLVTTRDAFTVNNAPESLYSRKHGLKPPLIHITRIHLFIMASAEEELLPAVRPPADTDSRSMGDVQIAVEAASPNRRHSLPFHFLPPSLWSVNSSTTSLIETNTAAKGEHIIDETAAAHRISALRQLKGAAGSCHRYAKSTGARNSTYSQPVIVRTYSGAVRPKTQQQVMKKDVDLGKISLPPIEAFSFKGIMESIQQGVAEDLERIAEICARSRYSLSNQYEVHMPPHGGGLMYLQTPAQTNGPTLETMESDDEHPKQVTTRSRGSRRTRSIAYGTLETIMSSSRSSEEDNTKKKSAAVLAEHVRGRSNASKEPESSSSERAGSSSLDSTDRKPPMQISQRPGRSRPGTLASLIIENSHTQKLDASGPSTSLTSPALLISEPARPQTSTAAEFGDQLPVDMVSVGRRHSVFATSADYKASGSQTESAVADAASHGRRGSILGSFSSWMSWSRSSPLSSGVVGISGRQRSGSYAEGSLRELLKGSESGKKDKDGEFYG